LEHNNQEPNNEDKAYCLELMKEVLKVGYEEGDIKKLLQLGKKVYGAGVRPLLLEFSNGHVW
jgi:hypothetical protein